MTAETSFWLVRHAPTLGAAGVIHPHDAPADLRNAPALARLAAALPCGAASFASPSRRTMETATALGLSPRPLPDLREQHFGSWTSHRHDDLAAAEGPRYEEFWRAPASSAPPGGESFVDQVRRTDKAMRTIEDPVAVLAVHSGTIRAALTIALQLEPERGLSFMIDPLSLTRIDRLRGGWRIGWVNLAA